MRPCSVLMFWVIVCIITCKHLWLALLSHQLHKSHLNWIQCKHLYPKFGIFFNIYFEFANRVIVRIRMLLIPSIAAVKNCFYILLQIFRAERYVSLFIYGDSWREKSPLNGVICRLSYMQSRFSTNKCVVKAKMIQNKNQFNCFKNPNLVWC